MLEKKNKFNKSRKPFSFAKAFFSPYSGEHLQSVECLCFQQKHSTTALQASVINAPGQRDGRGLIVSQYRRINPSVLRDYRLLQLTKSIIVKLTSLKSLCHNNSFVVDKSKIIIL